MPKVFEVDDTGVRAASLAENQRTLNERQREAFGEDLADSPQTPQAQWAGIGALALTEVGEEGARASLYGSSVPHSTGTHLDAHGSLLDVRRRTATRSRVTAILTGVAGTGVEAGALAKTTEGGHEFRTLADAVLSPTGVVVDMEAVETGPILAPADTLTEIVTVIAGWETITNPEDATPGVARQTDDNYKATYNTRTAHSSIGPIPALEAAIEEALAGRQKVVENDEDVPLVIQEWTLGPHSILAISEGGSDGDVRRAVENHRGMGVGSMSAIRAGEHDDSALGAINNGTIQWNGADYPGLDLTGAGDGPARAAALTAHLAANPVAPTVSFIRGRYVAIFRWRPDRRPDFGDNAVSQAFGLDPDASAYPAGPFVRPVKVPLTVSFTLTRRPGFPADGLGRVRRSVLARVNGASDEDVRLVPELQGQRGYRIGEELWSNDLLCEAERVPGTRVTNLVVQAGGADVSGVAIPLDTLWSLALGDLTINVA